MSVRNCAGALRCAVEVPNERRPRNLRQIHDFRSAARIRPFRDLNGGRARGSSVLAVREVPIRGDTIRLGQLLKLAGVIDSGAEVKGFLASAPVSVNGEAESRRGRQLHPGDVVHVAEEDLLVGQTG
jgi:ribosome-associated protein